MPLKDLSTSSKIAILGFGKEWKASMDFLIRLGFSGITILDIQTPKNITEIPKEILYIFWNEYLDTLSEFDLIIKSPGISPYQEKILPHRDKLISQTQIFFEYYQGKLIGITGTKWKSTVASLTYKALVQAGFNTKLVWNIGTPVLQEIDVLEEETYDYIVYELSSYMLEGFCPPVFIGYINNIHECHLDWHTHIDIYTQAKYNILKKCEYGIVHNSLSWGDISFPSSQGYSYKDHVFYKNESAFIDDSAVSLLWEHNRVNICWVLTILEKIIPDTDRLRTIIQSTLQNFSPLAHRLEHVGIFHDISFVDDGIAVTPEATIAAIKSLEWSVQTLLTWWKDIGMDQATLEETIAQSEISHLVLFPDTWYSLFSEETTSYPPEEVFEFLLHWRTITAIKTTHMKTAIDFCFQYTSKDKTVLLSSAAQSYSLWKSFEEKWEQYTHYIKTYAKVS